MKWMGGVSLFFVCLVAAQAPTPAPGKESAQLVDLVKQQFGGTFVVQTEQPNIGIVADFDGDGIEDVAIVANSKDPLPDSYAFKYEVVDPYNSFFGFGNPRVTASMNKSDEQRNHALLVIFGVGKEGWHAATPKAKYVLINVPFDKIEVGRLLVKKNKPPVFVIKARESEVMDSAVWWDAKKKKWKWEPGDTIQ